MAYLASFLFGLAAWSNDPWASGALVVAGSLLSFMWGKAILTSLGTQLASNQKRIFRGSNGDDGSRPRSNSL